ncbi:hypothetical protein HID58_029206 [Brassica napus]|uniref:Uncharacterized protein n=1 Tax=Brassica napus TaxID=3708 RepID=A0ABQ8CCH0_BRANA|nr:hypothetical protein HID58_029206 [Brassica napus]
MNNKDLFKVAEEFQNILGYEKRYFMILGLEGSGVKNFSQCFNGPSRGTIWYEAPSSGLERPARSCQRLNIRNIILLQPEDTKQ